MSKDVYTKNAPEAIGPYTQAKVVGGLVFTSGQIPIDPATGNVVEGDIKEQAHQSCKNIKAILEEAGTSLENVVKTTCFLSDMGDFAAFNEVYEEDVIFNEKSPKDINLGAKYLFHTIRIRISFL